ncbi:T9SS type A sorting domain-containing protein [Spirosoma endbachense]|uniref:T9SS type A sorting domain-containing protein n=1 Tax=Spirosoma endbachense TaxID=2666025 RepID=A0A6P1VQA5_9BACT|nr:T9SS type A sorting domain-containing protein [Spirosoma endbachense]QHV94875.1 T9SS type A sorting domain-containing protein [Spirosoma endbachense]
MKKPIYLSLFLSIFLLSLSAQAQQVDLQGVSIGPSSPTPIAINQIQTVQVVIKNNGPGAIPATQALFTATIDPVILRFDTPLNFTDPSGLFTLTSSNASTLQVANNGGPLPGNAATGYIISFNVRGNATGTGNLNLTSTLSLTSTVSDNNGNNQSAAGSIVVTSALPVSLVSFTAQAQENRTVKLDWITSLETNNKGFLVERSKDLKGFEKVGEVSEVAANSNAQKHYQLIDQTPYSGTSYYRLTQIDLNGKTSSFPAVSVVLRDDAYGVYPNPVLKDQRFTLRLDEPETAVVKFLSADGRQLPLQKTGVQSGNLLLRTQNNLSAGVYIVTVEERGQTRQHRIVVE